VTSLTSAWPGDACEEWGLIAEIHYYDLLYRDADLVTAVQNGQLFYCILSISTARLQTQGHIRPHNEHWIIKPIQWRGAVQSSVALSLSFSPPPLHYPFDGQCVMFGKECAGMEEQEGATEEEKSDGIEENRSEEYK